MDLSVMAQPVNASGITHHVRIQPENGWAAFNVRELWLYRDLLYILALRDVKLRYKQTAIGVLWVIVQPLAAALIFAVIFGRFANLPSDGVPYLLMVFAATLAWNIFGGGLSRAGNSLITDSKLITKVYFPRIAIPISSSAAVLIDFAVGLAVMVVLLFAYGYGISINILFLPVMLFIALLSTVGVSLLLSALNVYYRDFMYALPFIVQVWMYASPVVYSSELVPEGLRPIYALNPMVGVIDGFRWSLLGRGDFPALSVAISLVVGILLLIAGALVFQRVERNFADVV
jgi:lipopolysaccharide transport system permease protein